MKLVPPEAMTSKYKAFLRTPMLGWVRVLIAWRVFGAIFHPLFTLTLNVMYPGSQYSWRFIRSTSAPPPLDALHLRE